MTSWVIVRRSDGGGIGEDVFVGGNFVDPAGVVGTAFVTETGQCTFETLDDTGEPDWRKVQTIGSPPGNSSANPVKVTLEKVTP